MANLLLALYSNKSNLVYISHKLMEYLYCYSFETLVLSAMFMNYQSQSGRTVGIGLDQGFLPK